MVSSAGLKTHWLSRLCGAALPEMPWFICYVWLQFLLLEGPHSITTFTAQLLFGSRRTWYPLFDGHSICGNFSQSLSLFQSLSLLLDSTCCYVFMLKVKLLSKQENLILHKRASSCSAISNVIDLISFATQRFVLITSMDYLKKPTRCFKMMNCCEFWHRNNQSTFKLLLRHS